jgi:hypothetical protein
MNNSAITESQNTPDAVPYLSYKFIIHRRVFRGFGFTCILFILGPLKDRFYELNLNFRFVNWLTLTFCDQDEAKF